MKPDNLFLIPGYARLWRSVLLSNLGGQITMFVLPVTGGVLLHASPTQMGLLGAMKLLPFVLLSLPAGVYLDRIRKLPVYIEGELLMVSLLLSVPLAWHFNLLSMAWLYGVGFGAGVVYTVAGSASQIVLTQVVSRDQLVKAHAQNAIAGSAAEVIGPGIAGLLIKVLGGPLTLLADCLGCFAPPSCSRACADCPKRPTANDQASAAARSGVQPLGIDPSNSWV